jgi:aspartyl-tRNA(Asn)/glutamyl-tRNA(Gln) amidotransferase subunit B
MQIINWNLQIQRARVPSMGEYTATIGLEIHAELKTTTKMFCNSKNDSDERRPNFNVCPVCLAHPGALPVVNMEAVRKVLQIGLALDGSLSDYTEFDRKNYFYPDLPKGYQISQFAYPLVLGGSLNGVKITRVHLEEDTASSMHDDATGTTTIDFNRAGIPLMELVTEPVIGSAAEAGKFARELQILLRYLGASEANMEKGEMRVEANISVSKTESLGRTLLHNTGVLGTKVEVKNLNSFRIMERAVSFEINRQQDLLDRGGEVVQETRGWNESASVTFSQRVKEGSADYRYFPDPDLPSLRLSCIPEFDKLLLKKGMRELPFERRRRYSALGIRDEDAELYVRERRLGDFFDQVIAFYPVGAREIMLASNYIANDLVNAISSSAPPSHKEKYGHSKAVKDRRDMGERDSESQHASTNRASKSEEGIPITARNFKWIIDMVSMNKISSRSAKDLITYSIGNGRDPEEIAEEKALFQLDSLPEFERVINGVLVNNPKVVEDYRAGKRVVLEFLVGQCMKEFRGAADPVILRELFLKKLS